jgi:hypothetical protein
LGRFCVLVISDPFSRSFGELNTQKSPFSQIFHHFHTDNTHILSEKILIGKKTSAAGETTVLVRSINQNECRRQENQRQ